jgi:hypothetical protein
MNKKYTQVFYLFLYFLLFVIILLFILLFILFIYPNLLTKTAYIYTEQP